MNELGMQLKILSYTVGIILHIVSIVALPIAGKSSLNFIHLHVSFESQEAEFGPGSIDFEIITHPNQHDLERISAWSPNDVVAIGHCKRALGAASIFDEVLYRRYGGDGEGEEENGADEEGSGDGGDDGTSGNDNDDGDADGTQIASNSLRQDCI